MPEYALDHQEEAARLEKMLKLHAYQPSEEVSVLKFEPGQKVLDAGCGTGVVARYIADHFPSVKVEGCDFSEARIKQAIEIRKAQQKGDIRYFVSSVENIDAPDNAYDKITCRYVFDFLADPIAVLREFRRVLKPDGQLLVIQFDGVLHNFFHKNPELASMLETLKKNPPADLFSGRKIPSMMIEAGFRQVDWEVKAFGWKGEELRGEQEQTAERLEFASEIISKKLGSPGAGARFRELYCAEMMKPGTVLFYNKFLIHGKK